MDTLHMYPADDSEAHDLEHGDACRCEPDVEPATSDAGPIYHRYSMHVERSRS